MLQHRRILRVIPLLSKKNHLEEFIISEDHFLQEYQSTDDSNGYERNTCDVITDTCLAHSAYPKKYTIEKSQFTDKIAATSRGVSEYVHGSEDGNTEIIDVPSECSYITTPMCCFANIFQSEKSMNVVCFSKMDGQLFSFFARELSKSSPFRKAIIDRFFEQYCNKANTCKLENTKCSLCGYVWKSITIGIYLVWPRHCLMDKTGDLKIRMLVNERCEIENEMSWLSTLGGAYSSLGDEFLYHARQAEKVSLQQYRLALKLKDPLAVSRCKIFFAMSLVQQDYYKEAKQIIRKQYQYAITDEGRLDFRLANMCKAVWNKIKHMQSEDYSKDQH